MKPGCSVFVGNIAFDIDEQKVIEELSAVGKVVNFRLMYDKSTGKHKGYGFCEYESPLIAETAMKTLKINFNGRSVKINYAENDMPSKPKESATETPQIENIINVLDNFDENNLKEVILYLKQMAVDQPTKLRDILEKNPALTIALIASFYKLNLVEKDKIFDLVQSSFDLDSQKSQITHRISNMTENDTKEFPEDIRMRLNKLKEMITKKKSY